MTVCADAYTRHDGEQIENRGYVLCKQHCSIP